MRDQTRALVKEMVTWPWFQHVGKPLNDPDLISVDSWGQAFKLCGRDVWANVTLQSKNRFTSEVSSRDWSRGDTWNTVVDEIKSELSQEVHNPAYLVSSSSAGRQGFIDQVAWDILLILMETEFSDICPPILYANRLAKWYEAGHFPCGWDGPKLKPGGEMPLPSHRLYVF